MTKKLQNSRRCLHAAQGIVVCVIFEIAVNAASKGKFFLEKKCCTLCQKLAEHVRVSKNLRAC